MQRPKKAAPLGEFKVKATRNNRMKFTNLKMFTILMYNVRIESCITESCIACGQLRENE